MDMTEALICEVATRVNDSTTLNYQNHTIELSGKWRRLDLMTALEDIEGFNKDLMSDKEELLNFASSKGIHFPGGKNKKDVRIGKAIMKIFENLVEPQLIQPTFVTGYPVEVSPLSRRNDDDSSITDRFELFIAGSEIANGFSELNDPEDQKERFLQQVADREAGDGEAHYMDDDYIEALEYGMPPTAGEGIGIDRLTMLLTNSPSIREVILFPHMRPKVKE
jgi:lysyl-tRNA synthetase class 2